VSRVAFRLEETISPEKQREREEVSWTSLIQEEIASIIDRLHGHEELVGFLLNQLA